MSIYDIIARLQGDKENEVLIFALFITIILRSFEHATEVLRESRSNTVQRKYVCSQRTYVYTYM